MEHCGICFHFCWFLFVSVHVFLGVDSLAYDDVDNPGIFTALHGLNNYEQQEDMYNKCPVVMCSVPYPDYELSFIKCNSSVLRLEICGHDGGPATIVVFSMKFLLRFRDSVCFPTSAVSLLTDRETVDYYLLPDYQQSTLQNDPHLTPAFKCSQRNTTLIYCSRLLDGEYNQILASEIHLPRMTFHCVMCHSNVDIFWDSNHIWAAEILQSGISQVYSQCQNNSKCTQFFEVPNFSISTATDKYSELQNTTRPNVINAKESSDRGFPFYIGVIIAIIIIIIIIAIIAVVIVKRRRKLAGIPSRLSTTSSTSSTNDKRGIHRNLHDNRNRNGRGNHGNRNGLASIKPTPAPISTVRSEFYGIDGINNLASPTSYGAGGYFATGNIYESGRINANTFHGNTATNGRSFIGVPVAVTDQTYASIEDTSGTTNEYSTLDEATNDSHFYKEIFDPKFRPAMPLPPQAVNQSVPYYSPMTSPINYEATNHETGSIAPQYIELFDENVVINQPIDSGEYLIPVQFHPIRNE